MNDTNITVEVHALQPRWIDIEKPRYRLYVNDDLFTERSWIWNQQIFIKENLSVYLETGINHTIRIEIIKSDPMYLAQFGLRNLRINNSDYETSDHGGYRSELGFIIDNSINTIYED
jgi:hypothetical protein